MANISKINFKGVEYNIKPLMDTEPTANSTNAVQSGGVKSALDGLQAEIPTVDVVPTQGSTNAVSSGGVWDEITPLRARVNDVEDNLSAIADNLISKHAYTLTAPESLVVPQTAKEQSVNFAINGTIDDSKIITNKVTSGKLPYTPPSNGTKTFSVANEFFSNVTGSHLYILMHITLLSDASFVVSGSQLVGYVFTENGVDTGARKIEATGWYYFQTGNSFSSGYGHTNGYTIDHMVAIDSGELSERYPDITWDISTVISNFPVSKYGTLDAGETYSPQVSDGSITITHNEETTTYTGQAVTATIYPDDVIASTAGSVAFELTEAVNLVKTVNNISPDANGNINIGNVDADGVPQIALMLCKNKNLNYNGEANDTVISGLDPNINDAYLYRTDKVHGLYKEPVCDGDIIYWDGANWRTMRLNPSTFDLYENERHYDVVIVGGGAGGIGAAYALKDSGYTVCIVESLDSLGGTHTNAGVIQMLSSPAPDFLKTIIRDLETNGYAEASNVKSYGSASESAFDKAWRGGYITPSGGRGTTYSVNPWAISKRYYDDFVDAGIDVLLGCDFVSVSADTGVVENITIKHRHSGLTEKIWGFYFIDASSFASLCIYGKTQGTDYYTGTDTQARFNESAIPNDYVADVKQVNSAEADYMLETVTGATFDAPICKSTDAFAAKQGLWSIPNTIGKTIKILSTDGSDRTAKFIFNTSLNKTYEYAVDQSKNRTKDHFKKYFGATSENRFIKSMPLIAMRETNRIVCDEMLVQDDITTLATSQNYATNHYVALASWHWDLHNGNGVTEENLPTTARLCGLPYEAIIPTTYKNVLVASKCFGASHIALSYFRLTKTCMSIGWAAGNAVKLAIADGYLDDLRNVDIDDLQTAIGIGDMLTDIETYFELT